jgi:hypothetical protein
MSMKTILLPVEHYEDIGSAMQTALLLARRFESYIEGFALQNSISDFATFDIGGVALAPYTEENMEQAKKARAIQVGHRLAIGEIGSVKIEIWARREFG